MKNRKHPSLITSLLDSILFGLHEKRMAQVQAAQDVDLKKLTAEQSERMRSLALELLNDDRCPAYQHARETKKRINEEVDREFGLIAGN